MEKTDRGFWIFADTGTTRVIESSLAFEGPHVRIYGGRDPEGHVHLSLSDAKKVIEGLTAFVVEAEAHRLTEKPDLED